ncbi:MAG: sulfite exporter TauE/SafE family protein [Oscillospiraceae bacterium]|nr:sulfite exporter TauE/SafE family protein [Oscillospiraceae bacterium]
MTWWHMAVGLLTGVVSGLGIGGGTLLMLYITSFTDVPQQGAAGINLLYFVCCAPAAIVGHIKNKLIDGKAVLWAAVVGVAASLLGAWLSGVVPVDWLRRGFGALLLVIGVRELFAKKEKAGEAKNGEEKTEEKQKTKKTAVRS